MTYTENLYGVVGFRQSEDKRLTSFAPPSGSEIEAVWGVGIIAVDYTARGTGNGVSPSDSFRIFINGPQCGWQGGV